MGHIAHMRHRGPAVVQLLWFSKDFFSVIFIHKEYLIPYYCLNLAQKGSGELKIIFLKST